MNLRIAVHRGKMCICLQVAHYESNVLCPKFFFFLFQDLPLPTGAHRKVRSLLLRTLQLTVAQV